MKILKKIFTIILILTILFLCLIIKIKKVDGDSMQPNLKNGDIFIYQTISKKPKRFDIVIVEVENTLYIKRVIGLPGDTLEYKNDQLFIKNKRISETYNRTKTKDFSLNEPIPEDQYLVLGDNRSKSYDGRDFGLIHLNDIKGKLLIVL